MSVSDESKDRSISTELSECNYVTDIEVLIGKIKHHKELIELTSDVNKNYLIAKVNSFCSFDWVKRLDDEQRFECFLGYFQYELLRQGLRGKGPQQARDFVFYGLSASGNSPPTLQPSDTEER